MSRGAGGDGGYDRWRLEQVLARGDMATCEARWIGGAERARALLSAIEADDPEMFTAEIIDLDDGQVELIVAVTADSIPSLQSTMDDLLACLAAAESSLDAIQG